MAQARSSQGVLRQPEASRCDATTWAMEAFDVARAKVYTLGSKPGCASDAAPLALPDGYEAQAKEAVALQVERAGVRLALLLNEAFK
ncbi:MULTISPECIES: S1/P1 nuclease [unclassified Caulobacter]|mgnify:CR=1 FL=1|uniref:S1/P1 nuclease n=1 Tax=unclassified Caulobacter TaxID=2648921 RepID=UPI001E553123|nr:MULTISPECIES: S1/P1 nuclease [unclassified Caulobacter]